MEHILDYSKVGNLPRGNIGNKMSETTMTPEDGSGTLTVNQAANAFESLMDTPANSKEESEGVEQEPVEAEAQEAEPQEEEVTEEEQEDDETEEEEQPRYKVKAAGEEKEVTLDELVKGYQLGADYTKRLPKLQNNVRLMMLNVQQ